MRIERSGAYNRGDPNARPIYRIIISLKLQFNIDRATGEPQRHNRIFDSVNVRYLYRSGERHDLLPKDDDVVSDIAMRNETGISTDTTAGAAATGVGHPLPALTIHAQHASTVTYERKLRSRRRSLTYETCPPRSDCHDSNLPSITSLLGLGSSVLPPICQSHLSVSPPPMLAAALARDIANVGTVTPAICPSAQLHLWTPEMYESMTCPVTVGREVDAELIDRILRSNKRGHKNEEGLRELRRYFHFDFNVEVRLREIGWGLMGLFRSSSQPPEIRARNDYGKSPPPDRANFYVSCYTSKIV